HWTLDFGLSGGCLTTEKRHDLARHITRISFGCEINIGWRDLFRLSGPFHGCVGSKLSDFLRRPVGWIKRSPHRPGRNAIRPNATLDKILSERLGERMNGALRRCVVE